MVSKAHRLRGGLLQATQLQRFSVVPVEQPQGKAVLRGIDPKFKQSLDNKLWMEFSQNKLHFKNSRQIRRTIITVLMPLQLLIAA